MSIKLHHGDCLEVLRAMPAASVDSVVTDPPYGLSFMSKKWDYDVPSVEIWSECLRVLKPGGHLLAFAGTRTQHRMAVRIEDAGFEIRDMIAWVYGSGFPKSHNLDGEWSGWGTALKPSLEPITVARKPLIGTVAENVLAHGTGAINVDGCRVGMESRPVMVRTSTVVAANSMSGTSTGATASGDVTTLGRWPANLIHDGSDEVLELFPNTKSGKPSGTRNANSNMFASGGKGVELTGYGDSGSAARFFFRAEHEKEDLLFCRAKAILSAWKLTKGDHLCSRENASVAESSLCLSRQAAVSVLSDAVIAASRGDKLLSDVKGLSTTVTGSEFEKLCETLITAMLISESAALPAPSQDALIQNGCRVSVAAIQKPTDTMTITISLPTSDGYAEPVTFSIIPSSMDHGAKDLSADRFRYCAKASKADRDEGCEGLEEKTKKVSVIQTEGVGLHGHSEDGKQISKAKNNHPTVKPTALMRYLCRLVTPPRGIVLDPFMGSGSTGKAAILEGFNFIGIEREAEYLEIATARIKAVSLPIFSD